LDELKRKNLVPKPLLSLISVDKIQCEITAVPDNKNIFLPPRAMLPDIFAKMIADQN